MVGVLTAQVIDVRGDESVIDQALEKLIGELGIKSADHAAGERHMHGQARAAGKIDHHTAEGFIERHKKSQAIDALIAMASPAVASRMQANKAKILADKPALGLTLSELMKNGAPEASEVLEDEEDGDDAGEAADGDDA